ncbi:zinc-alpha-2-glycoprotein [Sorex araneus]|uniref:zinc-alpha-2-glycoprotein n=1 Tax=Sorex araneus TaxID=42254 RepID=UPI00243356CE|nr:zinc-alpha-2-glycoprotein [Sorex araneus]
MMVPLLLSLLLLLEPVAPLETPVGEWGPGRYSLSFLYTGQSRPRPGEPSFRAMAYLNDQALFRYDSTRGRAEPLGPWAQLNGVEDWEKESKLQKARGDFFLEALKDAVNYYKDPEAPHTFQGRFGCELQNNVNSGAFWSYAYDGRDFITFNQSVPTWVVLDPAAGVAKGKWEAEAEYLQRSKAYLEEECPAILRRYLHLGQHLLDRRDAPSVTITNHKAPGHHRRFKCRADEFYPPGITLRWTRAGRPLEPESRGDVLPSGSGTYQSWVVVRVSLKDGSPLACHVEHSTRAETLLVQWDTDQGTSTQ